MPQALRRRMRWGHHHANPFRCQLTHLPAPGPRRLRQRLTSGLMPPAGLPSRGLGRPRLHPQLPYGWTTPLEKRADTYFAMFLRRRFTVASAITPAATKRPRFVATPRMVERPVFQAATFSAVAAARRLPCGPPNRNREKMHPRLHAEEDGGGRKTYAN